MTGTDGNKIYKIDDALEITGFGKYSILLLFTASIIVILDFGGTISINYALPYATCDLKIDDISQGALNAASLFGDAFCGLIWGTAGDRYGRKSIIIVMVLVSMILSLGLGFAPTSGWLIVINFLLGIMLGSLSTLTVALLCEFHAERYRAILVMFVAFGTSISTILIPAIAIGIIPMDFSITIGSFIFKSWRLYLIIAIIVPSILTMILVNFCYESPKYLLLNQGSAKAIEVLKRVYVLNTGKTIESFPIFELEPDLDIEINRDVPSSCWNMIWIDLINMGLIFKAPYRNRLFILIILFFTTGLTGSTFYWIPQYFALASDYDNLYGYAQGETVCGLFNRMITTSSQVGEHHFCINDKVDSMRFFYSIIVGCSSLICSLLNTVLIRYIGSPKLLAVSSLFQGVSLLTAVFLPWASVSLVCSAAVLFANTFLIVSLASEAFPTGIRAFGIATATGFANVGSGIGNIILSTTLESYCQFPFVFFAIIAIVISSMIILLRNCTTVDKIVPKRRVTKNTLGS